MKCSNCKAEVDVNAEFCPYCGNKIVKHVNDIRYKIMILLLLFCLPIGIFYYYLNREDDYRMEETFKKIVKIFLVPYIAFIVFLGFIIIDAIRNAEELTEEEAKCSFYCIGSGYKVEENYCYCNDGKSKKLDNSIENEPSKEEIINENNNDAKIEVSIVKSDSFDTEKWLNEVKSKNVIINVIASSTCPHCHNFNPIIEKVATDNNIKLYFIEVDKLENEKYIAYTNSIEIPGYRGYVPYTFITYDGKVVSENEGELDSNSAEALVKDVLKQYK